MPNHLIDESSPYLLQHANNPVDWYPWGAEVLQKAKTENKPIFLSIGYAACHWCHVMAHESFEDEYLKLILHCLQAMARGGMYNVVGGGFSRYSTDNHWRLPHFEK